MKQEARKDGLHGAYLEDESAKTGTCCVMITDKGKNRSLVAYLGAANNMKVSWECLIVQLSRWKIANIDYYLYKRKSILFRTGILLKEQKYCIPLDFM